MPIRPAIRRVDGDRSEFGAGADTLSHVLGLRRAAQSVAYAMLIGKAQSARRKNVEFRLGIRPVPLGVGVLVEPVLAHPERAKREKIAAATKDLTGMFFSTRGSCPDLERVRLKLSLKSAFLASSEPAGRTGGWWSRRESNPRPPQCDCGALPTELRPHWSTIV